MASKAVQDEVIAKIADIASSRGITTEAILEEWIDQHSVPTPTERTLRHLFDLSVDMLCIADLDGYFKYVNPAFTRILGYGAEELIRTPFLDFIHPDDREATIGELEKLSHGIPTIAFENRYRTKAGSYRWFLWTASSEPVEGQIYAVAHDITERKRLEGTASEARHDLETRFEESSKEVRLLREILEQTSDLVAAIDLQGNATYMNEPLRHLIHSEDEHPNLLEMFAPESFEFLTQVAIPAAIQNSLWSGGIMVELLNGYKLPLSLVLLAHKNEHGETEYISGIARDISARTNVEQELRENLMRERELSELKSRFISMVSHEFRTPLAVILSSAEMLKRYWERLTLEKQHEYLDRIRAHVQHLKDLVSKVLDISSSDAVEVNFKPITVDMREFFQEVMTEIGYIVRETNKFNFTFEGNCTDAYVDPALLRLALNNLILNAAKYSAYGSPIEVSLHCTPALVQIEIKDQGIGIPPNEQKYLFNPFFRATNVGSVAGTGLGLAVVHQTIKAHSGTISVESAVGEGTTFKILLPTLR